MEVFSFTAMAGNLSNAEEKVAELSKSHLREVIDKVDAMGVDIKIATYNGDLIDGLKEIDMELGIDLIIISPRSNDIKEELYLGPTSGRIIKRTDIPTLIVPRGTKYKPFKSILTAFASGVLKKKRILDPLIAIQAKFKSKINLLPRLLHLHHQKPPKMPPYLLEHLPARHINPPPLSPAFHHQPIEQP